MTATDTFAHNPRPTVSIIMANYNGAAYLADAIESVENQTLRNIEIIISDDASTDASVGIVTKLMARDSRIRLLRSERNVGPAAARNKAIDVAGGEWIAVMDSDDLIHQERLAALVDLAREGGVDIIADDLVEFCTDNVQPPRALLGGRSWKRPVAVDIVDYIQSNHLYGAGPQLGYLKPMFRSELLAAPNGRYDESLRIAEDFDLVVRLLLAGSKMKIHPLPLYFYRKHSASISHRLSIQALTCIDAANLRFRQQVPISDRRLLQAVDARGRSIAAALAFERLLDALKVQRWCRSLRIALTHPRAAALLKLPIAVRLRGLMPGHGGHKGAVASSRAPWVPYGLPKEGELHSTFGDQPPLQGNSHHADPVVSDDTTDAHAVTVCICTFRRTSVVDAVISATNQRLPPGASHEILVIDNDDTPSARALIDDYNAATDNKVRYVHAPGRNISIARNAALDAVTTPWLAFLDDDEQASPDWLYGLLSARASAHAVFGPCIAVYHEATPSWIRAGDYHSNRILNAQELIVTGYTSNVLINVGFVRRHGLRFDPTLGRTGGEDTIFFYALHRNGGTLKYARDAIVYEHVVPSRLNARWVAVRRYRAGQVYGMMFRRFNRTQYRRVVSTSPVKIVFCVCTAAILGTSPSRAMWWLMRGAFHLGILSNALGTPLYEEYSSNGFAPCHAREANEYWHRDVGTREQVVATEKQ